VRTIEKIKTDYEKAVKCWETESEDCPADDCENCEYNTKKDIHELRCELLQSITADIPFDRIQEICEAERDGRCVVLPCKVGDTVYWADADGDEALELPLMGYWVTVFSDGEKKIDGCVQAFGRNWSKPFGTCLFLTREEAEQALKGGASE